MFIPLAESTFSLLGETSFPVILVSWLSRSTVSNCQSCCLCVGNKSDNHTSLLSYSNPPSLSSNQPAILNYPSFTHPRPLPSVVYTVQFFISYRIKGDQWKYSHGSNNNNKKRHKQGKQINEPLSSHTHNLFS